MDINLSNDDEIVHLPEPNAPADQKIPACDDARDERDNLAKPTAPGLIGSDATEKSKPSATDRALVVPPCSGMAESAYTLLLGGQTWFLMLLR
jgi:hypothetical protein